MISLCAFRDELEKIAGLGNFFSGFRKATAVAKPTLAKGNLSAIRGAQSAGQAVHPAAAKAAKQYSRNAGDIGAARLQRRQAAAASRGAAKPAAKPMAAPAAKPMAAQAQKAVGQATNWVKKNPGKAIGVGAGAVGLGMAAGAGGGA